MFKQLKPWIHCAALHTAKFLNSKTIAIWYTERSPQVSTPSIPLSAIKRAVKTSNISKVRSIYWPKHDLRLIEVQYFFFKSSEDKE